MFASFLCSLPSAATEWQVFEKDLEKITGTIEMDSEESKKYGFPRHVLSSTFLKLSPSPTVEQSTFTTRGLEVEIGFVLFKDDMGRTMVKDPSGNRVWTTWVPRSPRGVAQHPILLWKKTGDRLTLEAVLDLAFGVGYGGLVIKEIGVVDESRRLVILHSIGSDADQTWAAIWAALFTPPNDLRFLYQLDYSSDTELITNATYVLDKKRKILKLRARQMRLLNAEKYWHTHANPEYSNWEQLKAWTVNLGDLISKPDAEAIIEKVP